MAGFYAGGVLTAVVCGAAADILQLHVNSMLFYIVGACIGGLVGLIGGQVVSRMM